MKLIVALFIVLASQVPQQPSDAPAKTVPEQAFYVAGYQVRTNNANEMSGHGEIGMLWQRFFQQNLGSQIPDRSDARLIVVYSDYASDEKGDYSYLLGAPVSSVDHLPVGMAFKKIVPGSYAILTTEQGPLVEVLQAEWKKIWTMQPAQLGGKRAFLTDYEVYDARSANPRQAQVEIHVGLQPAPR
ncbi:MAG TPA: GyrI-like domain-containing protein [Terracidiphilus sp.]|jgi:predicted transcriptional regulator YdeE